MGANGSKNRRKHPLLSESEYSHLETLYRTKCGNQGHLTEKEIRTLWNRQASEALLELLVKFLFKTDKNIDFLTFIQPYVSVLYGSVDEKLQIMCGILGEDGSVIPVATVFAYVHGIISSYMLQMDVSKNKEFLSWQMEKFEVRDEDLKLFAEFLCQDLPQSSKTVSVDKYEKWMSTSSRVTALEKFVYRHLYFVENSEGREQLFIPRCIMLPRLTSFPSILDMSNVLCLNSSVPERLRDQWRLLFSTAVHGESFSKLLGHICNKGATMLIIRDKQKHVFGGFAPASWALGPNFTGDDSSFLFTLRPAVNVYHPTNYNNNYQYMNIQQQTLPNGLGMGGVFGYFGLWLDAEFGQGHSSETCTTYRDYKMLSGSKEFQVDHMEVWGIGAEPKKDSDDEDDRSILDRDKAGRAMMEMLGKTYHSDGLREPEEKDD